MGNFILFVYVKPIRTISLVEVTLNVYVAVVLVTDTSPNAEVLSLK